LKGNIVDPLGDVLMKLFPDGFVTALPPALPTPTVELGAAIFPAGGLDMEGADGGAAITAWAPTLERASARIDKVIVIFMISSPGLWRPIRGELSRSRTIFHGSVPTT
jgi:hypothetical protein